MKSISSGPWRFSRANRRGAGRRARTHLPTPQAKLLCNAKHHPKRNHVVKSRFREFPSVSIVSRRWGWEDRRTKDIRSVDQNFGLRYCRGMNWTVTLKESVIDDLRWFGRKDGRLLLHEASLRLAADPQAENRNMKTLRPNRVAQRELRLSGKYRVLFNLRSEERR